MNSLIINAASALRIILSLRKRSRQKPYPNVLIQPKIKPMESSHCYRLLDCLAQNNDEEFFKFTRLTINQFFKLLDLISQSSVQKDESNILDPEYCLAMVLYYLSSGDVISEISQNFYVSQPMVKIAIASTCEAIWKTLNPMYVKPPNKEEWRVISKRFNDRWGIPNCLGVISQRNLPIQSPYEDSENVSVLSVCSDDYSFSLIEVLALDTHSSKNLFKVTSIGKAFDEGNAQVPDDVCLPGTETAFPHYMIGSKEFPLERYIMKPYSEANSESKLECFNDVVSKVLNVAENSFGVLASRWRILQSPLILSATAAEYIVCATLALHNFARKESCSNDDSRDLYCPPGYTDHCDDQGNAISGEWRQSGNAFREISYDDKNCLSLKNVILRDSLANHFFLKNSRV